ncbi:flagellar basal body-associated FliL family protein [Gellertiella hungarica]|uniref:Flagellar protein FliL n=1 Tax=Gellertiella hungarica TaxID=1572859 RepID=A0A7W6J3J0_9HYPH|nr:flagellar basal body-associated FliL family protein [Gellertiella hungarica]MBB4064121.1 flagellar FliL protein [Gellertiella hungarica]
MADEAETEDAPKKKGGLVPLIGAFAVLTLVGGGGGWVLGGMLAEKLAPQVAAAKAEAAKQAAAESGKKEEKKEEGLPKIATEANGIVQLEPITTNLAYPSENWIKLDVALMFNGPPDPKLAEEIHQDILGYLRTVSLQQIEGPRGFEYLRDDIQERVDLRSEGRVSKVMFRTFVIE